MSEIDWSKAPEGATHYWAYNGCFFEKENGTFFVAGKKAWGKVYTTHSFEAELIPRPSPAWSGEGRPPVGTVCEALWNESRNEWLKTKVFGVNEHEQPVHRWEEGPKKFDYQASPLTGFGGKPYFRPIRTPEQIAADEREAAVMEMLKLDPFIPGRTLGELNKTEFCRKLHDAGYRKQADK